MTAFGCDCKVNFNCYAFYRTINYLGINIFQHIPFLSHTKVSCVIYNKFQQVDFNSVYCTLYITDISQLVLLNILFLIVFIIL